MLKYNIQSYIDQSGNSPVDDWIKSLDRVVRARIFARIKRFEDGHFGDVKNLGDSLFEARLFWGPGIDLTTRSLMEELFCCLWVVIKMAKVETFKKQKCI